MRTSTRYSKRSQAISFGVAVFALLWAPAITRAELLNYFDSALHGSSGAMTWPGTTWLHNTGLPNVNVYYAVYERATFNSVFDTTISGSDTYVYAYQLDNKNSTKPIAKFTVGLYPGIVVGGIGETADLQGADGTPTTSMLFGTGNSMAIWNYTGSSYVVPAGGKSEILFFTSPHAPTDGKTCSVTGTMGTSESGPVVSPGSAPEPSTLICLVMAGLCFVLFRPIRSMVS